MVRFVPSVFDGSGAVPPENQQTTFVCRDERSCLPRCHPHSAVCRTLTDGRPPSAPLARPAGRSALPDIAGALRRSLLVVRSMRAVSTSSPRVRSGGSRVHSPPSPPRLPPATGSLKCRSTGTRPDQCPYATVARSLGAPSRHRQARMPVRDVVNPAGSAPGWIGILPHRHPAGSRGVRCGGSRASRLAVRSIRRLPCHPIGELAPAACRSGVPRHVARRGPPEGSHGVPGRDRDAHPRPRDGAAFGATDGQGRPIAGGRSPDSCGQSPTGRAAIGDLAAIGGWP